VGAKMVDLYAEIDRSVLLNYLFYPRRQHGKARDGAFDLAVDVAENITIVCRAYPSDSKKPWILYFHGNGEVVSDYDGLAPLYKERGLNLLVADYRGYGASGGMPTFTDMIKDAGKIFETVSTQLEQENESGKWYVMGRSLGSISALELAASYPERLSGMIVESGFISVDRLIKHLGMPSPGDLSALEIAYRQLAEKIILPALIIHGQRDRLVPPEQGKELFQALGSEDKCMVVIPGADHNDIMFIDSQKYMNAITDFVLN
jgi:uncharacterized protein